MVNSPNESGRREMIWRSLTLVYQFQAVNGWPLFIVSAHLISSSFLDQ
nr:hypothetical protein Q903MT_gene3047 [Picea sitchensis]